MLNPNPAERLPDMAMVAQRLRDVFEDEDAARDEASLRPSFALVISEPGPDPESVAEATPDAADARQIGEPLDHTAVIAADVQATSTVNTDPAANIVKAACVVPWPVPAWSSAYCARCGRPACARSR